MCLISLELPQIKDKSKQFTPNCVEIAAGHTRAADLGVTGEIAANTATIKLQVTRKRKCTGNALHAPLKGPWSLSAEHRHAQKSLPEKNRSTVGKKVYASQRATCIKEFTINQQASKALTKAGAHPYRTTAR
eukprot:1158790-Pelagomonas_calceolata.AAC.15